MLKGIHVTNYANESLYIELGNPSETGMYISNIEGLGLPSGSISTTKGVNFDSSEYKDTVIEPRNIVITLGITNDYIVEATRQKIYNYFIQNYPMLLQFETDYIGVVHIVGEVETITPDIFSEQETIQISIICPDPYFYTGGKHVVKSTDKKGNFNFTSWYNSNVDDFISDQNEGYIKYGVLKPVSYLDDSDKEGIILSYISKVKNPKSFEIEIQQNQNNFYKIILEYEGGSIKINNEDLDEFDGKRLLLGDNEFINKSIVIKNDINDQNIYSKNLETGELTNIVNKTLIDGDLPNIKPGFNYFTAKVFGVYSMNNDQDYIYYAPDLNVSSTLTNSMNYKIWDFPRQSSPASKIVTKLYDNITKKYLGTMEFTNESCYLVSYTRKYSGLNLEYTQSERVKYNKNTETNTIIDQSNDGASVLIGVGTTNIPYNTLYWRGNRLGILVWKLTGDNYMNQSYNVQVPYKIAEDNIFTINGDQYLIGVKLINYNQLGTTYDNGFTSPYSIPLIAHIKDLQISEKDFFDYLLHNYGSLPGGSAHSGLSKNQLYVKALNYVTLKKENNEDEWNYITSDIYQYEQSNKGEIILSYDERYDAI